MIKFATKLGPPAPPIIDDAGKRKVAGRRFEEAPSVADRCDNVQQVIQQSVLVMLDKWKSRDHKVKGRFSKGNL